MKGLVALIPMKGYSERVPSKNIRDFCGKPLYHCILNVLLACPYIDAIYINTDSEAISADAVRHFKERVTIIFRPPAIRGDFIHTQQGLKPVDANILIEYDLSQVGGDYFLQTHSTNPLLKTSTVTKAIETFFEDKVHDSLFSVTRIQSRFYDHRGNPINHDPTEMRRTQDLPPVYEENSNLYIFSRASFGKHKRRIGENPILFEMSRFEAIDIDEEEDFKLAEYIYQCQQSIGTT